MGEAAIEKRKVGILFGGRSAEHEVSLQSARNVLVAIDRGRYDPVLVAIDGDGRWRLVDEGEFAGLFGRGAAGGEKGRPSVPPTDPEDALAVVPGAARGAFEGRFLRSPAGGLLPKLDVIFPVLHGPFGEDGTVQGLLRLAGVPFVGSGVAGSSICMDKEFMKRLLRDASIPTPRFLAARARGRRSLSFAEVVKALGLPLFVKPANLGSSVGISKVGSADSFEKALDLAFRFDEKIVIEEFVRGREIECSVLGNEDPEASVPGEVKPLHEFYSYEAKYLDDKGALLEIPARISEAQKREVRELAVRSFKALGCEGLARVDFFLSESGEVLVNELNTLPGFTDISMYPKLWEASGLPQTELVSRLIELAVERHGREGKLETSCAR